MSYGRIATEFNGGVDGAGYADYFRQVNISDFQKIVWDYYRHNKRPMQWRDDPSPYNVAVSEVMLQQTQVARVLEKFPVFIAQFPDFQSLAAAPADDVLRAWQGMGYNRRALYLHRLAMKVTEDYDGSLPSDPTELIKLPGIGPGTAGSIAAFAYNKPVVFIETNIRRVFIHHFFPSTQVVTRSLSKGLSKDPSTLLGMTDEGASDQKVRDSELLPLIESALDPKNPREWYYALMDYGTMLAKTVPNPNRRSRHYALQSKFEGSDRQIRGEILRQILQRDEWEISAIEKHFPAESTERMQKILDQMTKEKILFRRQNYFTAVESVS